MRQTVRVIIMLPVAALMFVPAPQAQTILPGPSTELPYYIGEPAKPHPLSPAGVPQDPYLAANPFNNTHNDSWMSDVYSIAGPLGRWPALLSSTLDAARQHPGTSTFFVCGTLTFDSHGRIVSTCLGPEEASLLLIDPFTLNVLAYQLLGAPDNPEAGYGSAYMYLDNRDRAVVTRTDHVSVFAQTGPPDSTSFREADSYDLKDYVVSEKYPNDNIQSVMPDWQGRLWFATRHSGLIGVFDTARHTVLGTLTLGEEISNSFAITADSAYVVTNKAMYRLTAGPDGKPRVVWRSDEYQNIGAIKPGQLSAGSGTSPTILDGGKYVAINDNAEQMHIVVYPTAVDHKAIDPGTQAPVCEVPVFQSGAGATEDSLVGLDRSLIVANEYGNALNPLTPTSSPSVPGIARVDIDPNGKGCSLVWTNDKVAAPQVGPKMSTKTGLVYFYSQKYDKTVPGYEPDGLAVYFWTAVDYRTGEIVWEQQVGTGSQFNSYLPAPAIGPSRALYVGLHGGLVSIRDMR